MGLNSIPTYSDRKAVYISESGLFISLGEFSKTPSDGTCLREPPGGVCDVGCCFWPHSRFFISLLFDVIRHPSVDYRQGFYTPFYTFSPAHRRAIRDTFILTFLGFSFLPRVLRFWVSVFYPRAFFYPTLLRLWLRWGQEHPIQDPPLCLPSQSCPFRLTHGLELQDHWFIICASEPRSIESKLNYWICIASSKSYEKTIKTLWTRLDYCL